MCAERSTSNLILNRKFLNLSFMSEKDREINNQLLHPSVLYLTWAVSINSIFSKSVKFFNVLKNLTLIPSTR